MIEIDKLEWDSNLFGYNVGRLDDTNFRSQDSSDFKLLYLYSDKEIIELEKNLVDKKITFIYQISDSRISGEQSSNILIQPYEDLIHDYNELLTLTYESGIYSRFYVDKNFQNNEFEKLYKIWIDNSLKKINALDVFVAVEEKTILGFVTLERKTPEIAAIGLIAVSSRVRGKKIATNLIQHIKKIAKENNFKQIQVVTQLDNLPAVKLYESNGFKLNEVKYIYHIWNNDPI